MSSWLVISVTLLLLAGWGRGQPRPNITLSLFEISPCSGSFKESVSRFESDIYVVKADLSNCTDGLGNGSSKIGFRVVSTANISTADYDKDGQEPVVFIGRQGNSGVVSWNIPLQPQGFKSYFNQVNRTMCPSNVTSQDSDEAQAQSQQVTPPNIQLMEYTYYMDEGDSLFYVDVFSSSETPVEYTIAVETVPHFVLEMGKSIDTVVGASSPQIYYFQFPEDISTVTVQVSTESNRCAFVSVQNNTCPINDLLENACSRGLYQTMSMSAYLTVEERQVLNREFVLIIITTNYFNCHGSQFTRMEDIMPPNSSNVHDLVFDQNITVTVNKQEPTSKFIFAILFPFIVFIFYVCLVCVYVFCLPRIYCSIPGCCKCKVQPVCPCSKSYYQGLLPGGSVQTSYNTLRNGTADSASDCYSKDSGTTSGSSGKPIEDSMRSIPEIVEPDEKKLVLPLMCKSKYRKLDKQYAVYSWNTITVGIFYALPAFQLVLSEQQILNISGNQDRCYFNFKCSHPLGVLSSFNNVWSNVGYFLLGLLFLIIVSLRKRVYLQRRANDKEYVDSHGIPQFYGIYKAMGIALILEGFMSAFYHICPTDANFQFDTAFMFIIGGLFLVKLFQNRHPDINANAFVAFFSFAVIIFMTLIGIYLDRNNPVAVRVTIFVFVIVLVAIFLLSYYRFHSWNLDTLKEEFLKIKKFFTKGPQHKIRFFKLVVIFLINLALVIYVIVGYRSIDIATAILAFFVTNLMLFLVAYVFQKFVYRETITVLPMVLVAVVIALWAVAFYFFILKASTNWEKTPAESRDLNEPCFLFGFYDYHDVWHFFSASALFFSFLFMLTLDDGLKDTHRDNIHIF